MALALAPNLQGSLSLTSPLNHQVELLDLPDNASLARPEVVGTLSRFESHPLTGRWTLQALGLEVDSAQMLVNTFPDDPFSPDTLADACSDDVDQPAQTDFVCRLNPAGLQGVTLEDDGDEDVFLLEGDFDGAFIQGQTITVVVDTEPGANLAVGFGIFRAARALEVAEETGPGHWELSFTIPPDVSNRYFVLRVRGEDVSELVYDVSVEVE